MSEDHFTCGICRRKLPSACFTKERRSRRGFRWACRECDKILRQTPLYLASQKWLDMKRRVRNESGYAHVEIRITRAEFIAWAVPLLEAWDWRIGSPSVDRINVKGHYELSNMQIISQSENCCKDKVNQLAPAGTKWCPDCNEYRPFSEFGKDQSRTFDLASHCRKHINARWRRRWASLKPASPSQERSSCAPSEGAARRWPLTLR